MAKSKAIISYSIGDLISEELPFVHVLDAEQKGSKCDSCLKNDRSLKRCSKCVKMFYCDKQCQLNDWFWHKNECKVFSIITQNFDDFLLKLLIRLCLLLKKSKDLLHKKYQLFNGLYRCLDDFESHEIEISSDVNRMKQFEEFYKIFKNCCINCENEELFRLYGQLLINTFSIIIHDFTYNNVKSGYGLYIRSSVFDHSCAPNACVIFDGIKVLIRAIRPISANEEIFIHYIPLDLNRYERKLKLQNQYYFHCNCVKCNSETECTIDYNKFRSLVNQLHLSISDEIESFDSNEELLALSEQIYGSIHPELAAILMIIMQFQLMSPQPNSSSEKVSQLIARVGRVIQLSFGLNHKFYRMYKMFINLKNISFN